MAEIAAWQRKNYKKVQSFADGGAVQDPPQRVSLTEEERQAQEEARDLSTIKDVDLGKKEKKPIPQMPGPSAGKTIQVEMDRFEMPTPYREEGRYTARIMSAAGMADGGSVKKRKR